MKRAFFTILAAVSLFGFYLGTLPVPKEWLDQDTAEVEQSTHRRVDQTEKRPVDQAVSAELDSIQKIRRSVVSSLSQPMFSNPDLARQLTGLPLELQIFNLDENKAYFTMPHSSFNDQAAQGISVKPKGIEWAQTSDDKFSGGLLRFDRYSFDSDDELFFRISPEDFNVSPGDTITVPMQGPDYQLSVLELYNFGRNRSVYGGMMYFQSGTRDGVPVRMANASAFVGKKGEPSLTRLVHQIVPRNATKEQTAQLLLNYVTANIDYSDKEANIGAEVMKRPNEVLMSGEADCLPLAILYASLLEQTNVDYRLVSTKNHITVAVHGNFPNRNKGRFNLGKRTFYIAEATVNGYQIGRTLLEDPTTVDDIRFLQKPGKDAPVYNAKTGAKAAWL